MFTGEPEIQAKRKILAVLTDECRKSVDAIRELAKMISDEKAQEENYLKIQSIAQDVKGYRRALTRNLAEMGSMIINKEDFMRAAYDIEELVDLIEGTAFRIKQVPISAYSKYGLSEPINTLTDKLIEMIIKLNDMIKILQINPEKVSDAMPSIENLEKEIDEVYRQALVDAFNRIEDIKFYLIVKEILERLDEISDVALSVADSLTILSVGI
mgnify:FL=1